MHIYNVYVKVTLIYEQYNYEGGGNPTKGMKDTELIKCHG